jgi:DNA adenine methylase
MQRCVQSLAPVIKWSGSKRKVAPILAYLLPETKCYFEPFVGSGAMLPFRPSEIGIAGDVIPELIQLWIAIRDAPELTIKEYERRWRQLQNEGHTAYYEIREAFNATRNPHDFLFLSRTCVNGLIRFNKNGDFNNSLHHTRPGISPERLSQIVYQWNRYIQDVTFIVADYHQTLENATKGDLAFLDPPYNGTKGRYMPTDFDFDKFYLELARLNRVGVKWILTFDGMAGDRTYESPIPPHLYTTKVELPTGNSPFTKLMKTSLDAVIESVYLNFKPPAETLRQVINFGQKELSLRANPHMEQSRLFN